MITNRVLEFILIAAPFVVLGGLLRRRCGFGIVILTAVLFLNFLFTALTSPIPLRWLFVVGPMALGCGIGLFAHSHKTFLLFQIMLGVLASLMSQIYKYYWAEWDPEGYGIVMLSKWGYSVINLTELLLLFFVILLIMRLLKLENKGWALLLALCLLSLDIDPIFLSYALVPIICSTLVGHYVRETGLEPSRILRIMEEIVGRYRRIVGRAHQTNHQPHWVLSKNYRHVFAQLQPIIVLFELRIGGSKYPERKGFSIPQGLVLVLGQIFTIVAFIVNLNYASAVQSHAENNALVIYTPGHYIRYGADWSYASALLVAASLPLGVMLSGMFSAQRSRQKSPEVSRS